MCSAMTAPKRLSADRDVLRTPHSVVNAGLSVGLTRHARDLSEYSWGHGGYYSPQRLVSISVPVEWSGRLGTRTWLGRGALSSSASPAKTSSNFGYLTLQAQAGNPVYKGSSSTGVGFPARCAERQMTRNLALGALLELDRAEDYSPTNLLLYARYFFDPCAFRLKTGLGLCRLTPATDGLFMRNGQRSSPGGKWNLPDRCWSGSTSPPPEGPRSAWWLGHRRLAR